MAIALRLFALLSFASLFSQARAQAPYDEACNLIVLHARQAAQEQNAGNTAQAQEHIAQAEAAFKRAKLLAPNEAQAYANMAVFCHNTHRFEESALHWREAKARVPESDTRMHHLIESKLAEAHYGRASVRRDRAYDGGQGNISEAIFWSRKQLEMRREPETLRSLATMLLMRAEVEPTVVEEAMQLFSESATIAFEGWYAGRRVLGADCRAETSKLYTTLVDPDNAPRNSRITVVDEPETYGVDLVPAAGLADEVHAVMQKFRQGRVYLAEARLAGLHGRDAVIASMGRDCWLFQSTPGSYADYAANLQIVPVWTMPPGMALEEVPLERVPWVDYWKGARPYHGSINPDEIQDVLEAVSVVSMATRSYYHWVMEALGRLLVAGPLLKQKEDMKLIVPEDNTGNKFMDQFLALLSDRVDESRLLRYNTKAPYSDTLMKIHKLHFVEWESVEALSGKPTHLVAPKSVLRRIRREFTRPGVTRKALLDLEPPLQTRLPLVLVAVRKHERMRILESEDELVTELKARLKGHAEVREFRSQDTTIRQAIGLFHRALVVVGVHGGALANTVFCRPETLLAEIAFRAPQAQHYAHAAMALDLEYRPFYVEADERSVAARDVRLADKTQKRLVATVEAFVHNKEEPHHGHLHSDEL